MTFCESTIDPTVLVRSGDETRATLADPPVWLQEFFGGGSPAAGVRVSESTALSASAVFGCVRNIAEDLAKLPLLTYRRLADGKERFPEHPVYKILHDDPNPEMTAFDFRQAVTASAVLWGGGYSEVERNGRGDPVYLWPIEPWRVRIDRDMSRRLVYIVDGKSTLRPDELMHIKGFSITGIVGLMIAATGKDSLGLTLAAQKFAAAFFSNGMNSGGAIEHPGKLSPQAVTNMRESWAKVHSGPENAHKPAILEEGAKFTKTGTAPNEAQMLETRQFQVEDVARWFRMPPHKIQHLLRSTFSNIEHQAIEYSTDTIMPWAVRWEQEIKKKLLTNDPDVFSEHLMDALLRGDTLTRSQAFEIQTRSGARNIDEWRAAENMNPLPNGMGKKHFVALNMTTIDRIGEPEPAKEPTAPPVTEPDPEDVRSMLAPLIADVARRVVRREDEALHKAGKRDDYESAARKFYGDHREYVAKSIDPLVRSYLAAMKIKADAGTLCAAIASAYCARSSEAVRPALETRLDDYAAEQTDRFISELNIGLNGVKNGNH